MIIPYNVGSRATNTVLNITDYTFIVSPGLSGDFVMSHDAIYSKSNVAMSEWNSS